MKYIVVISSRCVTTVSVEAEDGETAQELALNGEHDYLLDVEHDDSEVEDCQIDDGKVRF